MPGGRPSAEGRVALVPALVPSFAVDRGELFSSADMILQLQGLEPGQVGEDSFRPGQLLTRIGRAQPMDAVASCRPVLDDAPY